MMRAWPVSIATGQPFEMEFRLRGADGVFRWFLTRAMPLRDGEGRIIRWYGTNTDIDAERRRAGARRVLRAGRRRAGGALSLEDTLQAVTRLVVPEFADWALVNLIDGNGRITLGATYHRDPQKHARAQRCAGCTTGSTRRHRLRGGDPDRPAALLPGRDARSRRRTVKPELLETFLEMGLGSIVIVPLLHAGKAVGTLSVVRGPTARRYGEDDVPFFEQLARRIAPALGNAASYEREKRIAQTFQRAALHADAARRPGPGLRCHLRSRPRRGAGRRRLVRRLPPGRRADRASRRRRRRQRPRRGGHDGQRAPEHPHRGADQSRPRRRAGLRRPHRARHGQRPLRDGLRRRARPGPPGVHLRGGRAPADAAAPARRQRRGARPWRSPARPAPALGGALFGRAPRAGFPAGALHGRSDRVRPRRAGGRGAPGRRGPRRLAAPTAARTSTAPSCAGGAARRRRHPDRRGRGGPGALAA